MRFVFNVAAFKRGSKPAENLWRRKPFWSVKRASLHVNVDETSTSAPGRDQLWANTHEFPHIQVETRRYLMWRGRNLVFFVVVVVFWANSSPYLFYDGFLVFSFLKKHLQEESRANCGKQQHFGLLVQGCRVSASDAGRAPILELHTNTWRLHLLHRRFFSITTTPALQFRDSNVLWKRSLRTLSRSCFPQRTACRGTTAA